MKPGWDGADVLGTLQRALDCPARIHTDVTGAALAEGAFGAAVGCQDFVYITVGTGIGMGIIVAGKPVVASLHPEAGHIRVRRMEGDNFGGVCSYHEDCLEGLASGSAISTRARQRATKSVTTTRSGNRCSMPGRGMFDPVLHAGQRAHRARWRCDQPAALAGRGNRFPNSSEAWRLLAAYRRTGAVVAARLGADAGQRGALLLAEQALQSQA